MSPSPRKKPSPASAQDLRVPWGVPGFTTGAVAAGLKNGNALDLCVIVSDLPCVAGGVFTRNCVVGEPVKLDRLHLRRPTHRAVVVNAKISNVCTGEQGRRDAREMAARVADSIGCTIGEVFVASTGIIGRPLPMERIRSGIDRALAVRRTDAWGDSARAIMTTDLQPKLVHRSFAIGGKTVTLAGIAKGSGMIHPNMATMLTFICSDVAIEKFLLQDIVRRVADRSFNCVTVDGDTSTSDTMLVLANGAAGNRLIREPGAAARAFEAALLDISTDLARAIARDGEGATHLVTVRVGGAASERAARRIAHAVATSPLVKTAIFGRDANWGRITAAAGRAGVAFPEKALGLRMNDFLLFQGGQPVPFDEAALTATLSEDEIRIHLTVGRGAGEATVWTCDLTEDYIRINADYRS